MFHKLFNIIYRYLKSIDSRNQKIYPHGNQWQLMPKSRKIQVINGDFSLTDNVEVVYEKIVTPFGTSAKVDAQKKYIGRRAYVIILKD